MDATGVNARMMMMHLYYYIKNPMGTFLLYHQSSSVSVYYIFVQKRVISKILAKSVTRKCGPIWFAVFDYRQIPGQVFVKNLF